ncbi:cupin domain-containing protein [Pseudomonas sp. KCJK9044]|uniref:cupin domain-containing protein n=1 Tax=Pseudomonas sp. KCJK9044 TaxID=3344562 RepID=UPI0039069757
MPLANVFDALPSRCPSDVELVDALLKRPGLRIERIISTGQASPPGFWYDQAEGEWVVLLSGAAGLRLEHEDHTRLLKPGDCLDIPPHCRHRVEWTSQQTSTIWLAVFYSASLPWPNS